MLTITRKRPFATAVMTLLAGLGLASPLRGQPALRDLPGYERYQEVRERENDLVSGGTIRDEAWDAEGRWLRFTRGEIRFVFDLETRRLSEDKEPRERAAEEGGPGRRRGPGRGRQRDREVSPDGRWVAVAEDNNVVLESGEGQVVARVTTTGTRKHRFGRASWVYGEELDQREAMWWSPDSRLLVYYEFDEREVADYYLLQGWTRLRTEPSPEGYPKPGEPNPRAGLHVYEVESGRTMTLECGPFDGIGHYVYNVRFTPGGDRLLFSRTNRHQNALEVVAVDLADGTSNVVVREEQPTWQNNRPEMRFLEDGQRFIWETERSGFRHYELRHLDGRLLATLTRGAYPAVDLVRVDEAAGWVWYRAQSGPHPLHAQVHRVRLDGSEAQRLTDAPADHHSVRVAPDGRWFIAVRETSADPPVTVLCSTAEGPVSVLAEGDVSAMRELGVVPAEEFSFQAEDGTTLLGLLYKPSDFDPERRYPLVVDVYGGPFSQAITPRFRPVRALCEFGFLVARIDNRGTTGRGKAFESANYLRLGTVDLQDQVDGVRHLTGRPYVDGGRVGIYGHSYGGYMAALAILKHPDVFHVSVALSAVTDWRNYDSIYTERYMRTPEENPEGYDQGSCLTFAEQLSGRLLIAHGLVDDNVHPTNAWQLVDRLQQAGKRFDLMVYPDAGHGLGGGSRSLLVEYLWEHLIGSGGSPGG